MNSGSRMRISDPRLWEKLEELRLEFERDRAFPNVLAVWEAIERVTGRNKDLRDRGRAPHPIPVWINEYLVRSANKIARLSVGIRPDDDRALSPMSNFSELCEVLRAQGYNDDGGKSKQFRDERTHHVASALGFVMKGASAFQRNDRIERDNRYLRVYDDPQLEYDKVLQRDIRACVTRAIVENEGIDGEQANKGRLPQTRETRR